MMKQSRKIILISGLMIIGMSTSYADPCPTINSNQLRQLCRSKIVEKMGIAEAGHVKIGKVTLHNDSDTCAQDTSIKEFLKDRQRTYAGKATRNPTHPDRVSCIYVINNHPVIFTGQGVDLPGRPGGNQIVKPQSAPLPSKALPSVPQRPLPAPASDELREGDLVRAGELVVALKKSKGGKSPSYQEMLVHVQKEMKIPAEKAERILEELGLDELEG